jgi:glutathione S-transferase
MSDNPSITLYHLNSSRAIRIAWLLSALELPYNLIAADRAPNGLAPPDFRANIPTALRKSPTIQDGDFVIQESSAITEYLCEKYDTQHRLMPAAITQRARVREWIAASEGTFMMHAIAIMYARARLPQTHKDAWPEMNKVMSGNIHNALNWLDGHLKPIHEKGGKYLVGPTLTAADINMLFGLQLIYDRKLGLEGTEQRWEHVERWMRDMQEEESWKRAVEKTEFKMGGTL